MLKHTNTPTMISICVFCCCGKVFTPYEHMDDLEKFIIHHYSHLFYSHLTIEDITDADYTHAKLVWKDFDINILG